MKEISDHPAIDNGFFLELMIGNMRNNGASDFTIDGIFHSLTYPGALDKIIFKPNGNVAHPIDFELRMDGVLDNNNDLYYSYREALGWNESNCP